MIKKSVIENKIIKASNLRVFYLDKFIGINNKNFKKMLLSHNFNLEDKFNFMTDHMFSCSKCNLHVSKNLIYKRAGKWCSEEIINISIIINNKKIITENINNMYCDNIYSLTENYIDIIDILE